MFEFRVASPNKGSNGFVAQQDMKLELGPMALCYKEDTGWIAEHLGPTNGHWKRRACEARNENLKEEKAPELKKRVGTTLLEELEPYILDQKRRKTLEQSKPQQINTEMDGDEVVAVEQHRRA